MFIEAILLGLSSGTYCTIYCAPVLVPFLLGTEKVSHKRNLGLVSAFLVSRLAMYYILGIVLSSLGVLISEFFDPALARKLSYFAYMICGLWLCVNCLCGRFSWSKSRCCSTFKNFGNDWITAIGTGLGVGLHICLPLWTAIFRSVFGVNGSANSLYLVFFYIGTLPFFIPLLGIPFLQKRLPTLKRIARICQLLVGAYFLICEGLLKIIF